MIASHSYTARSLAKALAPLTFAALLLSGCDSKESVEAEEPRSTDPASAPQLSGARVEVAVITRTERNLSLRVPGEVEGMRDALLSSSNGGYIESVEVREGDHVRKGAVLARVDAQTYSTRLVRAQVELKAAERELERTETLGTAVPTSELDQAQDRVATAKAQLSELQVAASRAVVNAPFDGVVVSVDAEVGEVAAPGTPLFRLVQLQPIRVSIALADRDLSITRLGMPATVELSARSGTYEGKVVQISQAASTKTRSFEALVELPNEGEELLPGMIAQVTLRADEDSPAKGSGDAAGKLLISQDWLVTAKRGVGVFVARDGKAAWRDLKLGSVLRRQVEVKEGLEAGDRLIITGHRTLVEGDQVLVHREGRCCVEGRPIFAEEGVSPQ